MHMEAHAGCDTCSALWAEYDEATAALKHAMAEERGTAQERLGAAMEAIRIHAVVTHLRAVHAEREVRKPTTRRMAG